MNFYDIVSVENVFDKLENYAKQYKLKTERISIEKAVGRIAATDMVSFVDLPDFNRSTVDGYAVICSEVMGASDSMPSILTCKAEVMMGKEASTELKTGSAIYIPTGGMVPACADGVVMIEYCEKMDEETLLIYKPIAPYENITLIGDDLRKGDCVVKKGKKISAYDIGLLAGTGHSQIEVVQAIKVAILSTGDEIIDAVQELRLGEIRDINGYALFARVIECGGVVVSKIIVKDDFNALKSAVNEAKNSSDIVLISGGSSVGTRDYTSKVIESFDTGKVFIHGIAIKPGKPTLIGEIEGKLIFGLPGHPASALIIYNVFVKHYMDKLNNLILNRFVVPAILTSSIHTAPGKDTFQMVKLTNTNDVWYAQPIHAKSGMMTLLSTASGYIHISGEVEGLSKNALVNVNMLQEVLV